MALDGFKHAIGQGHKLVADEAAHSIAQAMGQPYAIGLSVGGIDHRQQRVTSLEIRIAHAGSLQPRQETGDGRAELGDIDQEGIVALG